MLEEKQVNSRSQVGGVERRSLYRRQLVMRQEKREDEQLEREDPELGTTIQRTKHEKRENGIEELGVIQEHRQS